MMHGQKNIKLFYSNLLDINTQCSLTVIVTSSRLSIWRTFEVKAILFSTQISVSRSYEYNATRHSAVSFFCICFIDCEKRIWRRSCIRVLYSVRWRKGCRGAWSHSSMHSSPTYWTEMAAHHYVFAALLQDKTSAVSIKYEAGLQSFCGRVGKEKLTCLFEESNNDS